MTNSTTVKKQKLMPTCCVWIGRTGITTIFIGRLVCSFPSVQNGYLSIYLSKQIYVYVYISIIYISITFMSIICISYIIYIGILYIYICLLYLYIYCIYISIIYMSIIYILYIYISNIFICLCICLSIIYLMTEKS